MRICNAKLFFYHLDANAVFFLKFTALKLDLASITPMAAKDNTPGASLSSDSKERWAKHAISKLSKGYKLIISQTRVSANFHKPGSGFETCPHKTAVKLVRAGYLNETGEHDLGIVYELKPEFMESATPKKKAAKKPKKVEAPKEEVEIELDDELDAEDLDDELDAEDLDDDLDAEELEADLDEVED